MLIMLLKLFFKIAWSEFTTSILSAMFEPKQGEPFIVAAAKEREVSVHLTDTDILFSATY